MPEPYGPVVLRHRQLELPIEAHIERIEGGQCIIRCRLVSREEVLQQQLAKREKARADLLKPYRPQRPLRSTVRTVYPHVDVLRSGDTLVLGKCATVEECLDDIDRASLIFTRSDGHGVFTCHDNELKKKIVRLGEQAKELVAKVLPQKRASDRQEYEIELTIGTEPAAKASQTLPRRPKRDGSR